MSCVCNNCILCKSRKTTKCKNCGCTTRGLKVEHGLSPSQQPRLVCVDGCTPYDSTAQVLLEIVKYIDEDKNRLSEEAREALAQVNGAVARQDARWNRK